MDAASNISLCPQGVDVQNLIKIDSAVAALRMREKNAVSSGFFCLHIRIWGSAEHSRRNVYANRGGAGYR